MSKSSLNIVLKDLLPPSRKKMAPILIEVVLGAIQHACDTNGRVYIEGFGVFERQQLPERQVRNPKTGLYVTRPAKVRYKFHQSKNFGATVKEPHALVTSAVDHLLSNAGGRGSHLRTTDSPRLEAALDQP